MTLADNSDRKQEIIIVRRGHDDEDEGRHGGVWKIAFADFMTAMMCFFLVMWLINAANEQTKSAVASYFNPVRLIDRNASRKGLQDLGDGPRSVGLTAQKPEKDMDRVGHQGDDYAQMPQAQPYTEGLPKPTEATDARLFSDPYAVLSEIATNTGILQNVSDKGEGGVQTSGPATGASGGQSYRDPFSPDFWSQQQASPAAEASAERARIKGEPATPEDRIAKADIPEIKAVPSASPLENAPLQPLNDEALKPTTGDRNHDLPPASTETKPDEKKPSDATQRAAAEIQRQLAEAFKEDRIGAGISVEATDKGVVVSVTDQFDFGMFEIGSAVPRKELVLAMEKIGRIVNGHKGSVVIQGHTDARPFHSETYDNWRLSTARAHSAYYMLVRAGVDERRITEVSGFADRRPKDARDPLAAVNRRIEILLETDG